MMEVASEANIASGCSSGSNHAGPSSTDAPGFDDFLQSGRTGRRNAVPDIVDENGSKETLPEIVSEG